MKKILFIVNPNAGVNRLKSIEDAVKKHLDSDKFDWKIQHTEYAHHGILLAKNAVEAGFDIVVAVGGDGSVNDVVQSLQGSKTALGVVPLGSGNGLARSVGLPLDLKGALAVINKLNVHAIDLGLVNEKQYFISNAGVGFDSVVTKKFHNSKKRGFWSYIKIIVTEMWRFSPKEWEIEIDGRKYTEKAFMITVANAAQLGYNFQIAPIAILNDGIFDIVIIKKHPKILSGIIGLQGFTDSILKNRYVLHFQGKQVKLVQKDNSTMQLDGDSIDCGRGEITIEMKSKSILLLCP